MLSFPTEGLLEERQEDIADYLREVLEECIGLDVKGSAVGDRLSLQATPPELTRLAVGLGVRRYSVCNTAVLMNALSREGQQHNATCGEEVVVSGRDAQGEEQRYYCLTPELAEVAALITTDAKE